MSSRVLEHSLPCPNSSAEEVLFVQMLFAVDSNALSLGLALLTTRCLSFLFVCM